MSFLSLKRTMLLANPSLHLHLTGGASTASLDVDQDMDGIGPEPRLSIHMTSDIHDRFIPDGCLDVATILNSDTFLELPPLSTLVCAYVTNRGPTFSLERECRQLSWSILRRCIPSGTALLEAFDDAFSEGAKSILVGSNDYLPIYLPFLITEAKDYLKLRSRWLASRQWLERLALNPPPSSVEGFTRLIEECQARLTIIPFSQPLTAGFRLHTRNLPILLGSQWVNDEIMNAGSDYILRRIPRHSRTQILDCFQLDFVRSRRESGRPLSPIEADIVAGELDTVYLPLNVNNNHWTLIHIDIPFFTISYGDSLTSNPRIPTDKLDLIHYWLTELFPLNTFHVQRSTFQYPRQSDSVSCGIVVLSTLAHLILQDKPWKQSNANIERLLWFLRLTGSANCIDNNDLDASLDDLYQDTTDSDSEPAHTSQKRPRPPPSHSSDDEDDPYATDSDQPSNYRRLNGNSESWQYQKALRDAVRANGAQQRVNVKRMHSFHDAIRKEDPRAEFDPEHPLQVYCSSCSSTVTMRTLNDTYCFKEHRKTKKCRNAQQTRTFTSSLATFGFLKQLQSSPQLIQYIVHTCTGLLREDYSKIDRYLSRTSATGGGAPAHQVLAQEVTGNPDIKVADLTEEERKMVLHKEEASHQWKNLHSLGTVIHAKCMKEVETLKGSKPCPCAACLSLLNNRLFQNAINRRMPDEKNMKFVPSQYQVAVLGQIYLKHLGLRRLVEEKDGRTPWLKFAMGAISGEYKSEIVGGMVEALVVKTQRARLGKKDFNMHYNSGFDEFCSSLASLSPVI